MTVLLRPTVSAIESDGVLVILDQRSGRYWQLNRTGTLAMRELLAGATAQEAARKLAAESNIPCEQATADIAALLRQLSAAKLTR